MFNLRFQVKTGTAQKKVEIKIDGNTLETASSGEIFVIPVSSENLEIGNHTVEIILTDGKNKTTSKSFTLSILAR